MGQKDVIDWIFGILIGVVAAFVMFGRDARRRAKQEEALRNLAVSEKSREIENEIDALGTDDLKRRAVKWVRDAGK
jgi:hypothetical protein